MRSISSLLLGAVIGGVVTWGAFTHHVLRTDKGLTYLTKRNVTLTEAYVDVRGWGVAEWAKHPDLMFSVTQQGRTDVMSQPSASTIETTLKDTFGLRK